MIRYRLGCAEGHAFDGWFNSIATFESQRDRGLVRCAVCGGEVDRLPMAPAVIGSTAGADRAGARELEQARSAALENSEDVGPRFAEEARGIHFGEMEARKIHGRATIEEARSLAEDGVPFGWLPPAPDELN